MAPTLTALGIVFGDIGTSPLYAMQTVLQDHGHTVTPDEVLGVLSLIVWTIVLVVAVKYCVFVMRADNDGEGGVLALTALVTGARNEDDIQDAPTYRRLWRSSIQKILLSAGLFGGALLFGDSVLTPSISVLSAMEGMTVAAPSASHYVLPAALAILVMLFVAQRAGTSVIGALFGPVMLVWFLAIGGLGLLSCTHHPEVLRALDPLRALRFLAENGWRSFILLGGVFLTVTGAEALYADMGGVGRLPVRLAWFVIVLPALLLCYGGQASALMDAHTLPPNPFYGLIPSSWGHVPVWIMVGLATLATIIASQSVVTGVFSLTQQAIQVGWFPGVRLHHTSEHESGQIYVPLLNWMIMAATLALTTTFGSSARLAGAYGMAVSTTMLLTSLLYGAYLHRRRHWPLWATAAFVGCLLIVDCAFFAANMLKIADGGYIPLVIALALYAVMSIWQRGTMALQDTNTQATVSPDALEQDLRRHDIPRTPGHVVFLSRVNEPVPPIVGLHVRQFGGLPQHAITLSIVFRRDVPRIAPSERIVRKTFKNVLEHITVHYGFMETPRLLEALAAASDDGAPVSPDDAIFLAEHDEIVAADTPRAFGGLRRWERPVFAFLYRNARHSIDQFALPPDRLVEIGRRIAL
ncbi:K+ transporter [Ameyamaea chiangmaiensis NBRC 103196]|uniref:Probable potassium transport system protein Kup n=2 Tax=Ameyamaea chiangmaiensis TaxID=442969 RepID=A0A850P7L6_9PROT|nr:KUP/HAK/KT family potassium transporter [Ameyamaea chiangmaiensis]MBS4073920.1 KUP/HAK/KT family potassium transporter [Ameyamaea chiangmaiensis]NVN39918.1 KUP/HAK/KT family potassium transporter [Ameyamaea chiangmaiensis]GBQ67928.1 K+ transporter [Ameyamaea chiangmaiensis NBRC 103196]